MIITLHDLHDKSDIETNAKLLALQNKKHQIINYSALSDEFDFQTCLYIVSHGNPKYVNGLTPDELAHKIGEYINSVHRKYNYEIDTVMLYSCNTGIHMHGTSYIEAFALALSNILETNHTVKISAPNGMLVFFPTGEPAVIHDPTPFSNDKEFMGILNKIDTSKVEQAKGEIACFLASVPFSTANAVSIKKLMNSEIEVDDEREEESTPHASYCNSRFFVSSKTYNWLTNQYAKTEQDEYTEKNKFAYYLVG